MAAVVRSEDQFLCSICLQLFNKPVTTPCGHNFCKACFSEHWDIRDPCSCPLCLKTFPQRPELYINTLLSEMVLQFKQETESRLNQLSKPGEVPCDVCVYPKLKALKSCLVCLVSYCETHLQTHLTLPGLKRHQLMDPVENLEHRMCLQHDKPLELFCCTDHSCICTICPLLEHKDHECVPLKEEYERRRSSLQQTQAQIQHMVKQRILKIHEIQDSLKLSQNAAAREKTKGLKGFAAMIQSVQRMRDQFIEGLQEKQKQTLKRAQYLITELKEEICKLEKRSFEGEHLSRSEDQLHFIQNFTSLRPAAALIDWSTVSFEPETFEDFAVAALSDTVQELTKEVNVFKAQLKDLKKFAVDITLDPDTAHPQLVLSEDLKQVHCDSSNNTTINPQRFTIYHCVLGKQSFASGRAYFEVQVNGNTWWILGVARESIEKKKYFSWGPERGVWVLSMYKVNEYCAYDEPSVPVPLKHAPQKVGVFVDYGAGVVSFYDVDTKDLIYSFTDCCQLFLFIYLFI